MIGLKGVRQGDLQNRTLAPRDTLDHKLSIMAQRAGIFSLCRYGFNEAKGLHYIEFAAQTRDGVAWIETGHCSGENDAPSLIVDVIEVHRLGGSRYRIASQRAS